MFCSDNSFYIILLFYIIIIYLNGKTHITSIELRFVSELNTKTFELIVRVNINGGDVQRKNVVNNVDKSSLWAP